MIVKPFGRLVAEITLKFDVNNQIQMQGKKFPMIGAEAFLSPIQICALLSQTVASTLQGSETHGKIGKEETNGEANNKGDGNNQR